MGYILPVDRYQYINYQERIRSDRSQVSPIEPSFKTVLDKKYEEVTSESDRLLPSSYKTISLQPKYQRMDYMYAEMTGKGMTIDETI